MKHHAAVIGRRFPPAPPEFADEFAKGGWERVELLYGARTDCIRKWIEITGARNRRALKAIAATAGKRGTSEE